MGQNFAMSSSDAFAPLSPQVMARAGVPLKEALWYSRIPSGRDRVLALATPTGTRILERIRAFHEEKTTRDAMPLSA